MSGSVRRWMLIALTLLVLPAAAALALDAADSGPDQAGEVGARPLRYGDTGEDVADLQRLLLECGFDPGPVDGIFGPLTRAAVVWAQEEWLIQVDGVAGPITLAELQSRKRWVATEPAVASLVSHGNSGALRFSLTFNGEPEPSLLPALLDILDRHKMQATFFVQGRMAVLRPELLNRIVRGGHEIASNGYESLDMTRLTPQMMKAQLGHAQRTIEDATGMAPRFFRPPQGRFNDALSTSARALSLQTVLWTNVLATDTTGNDTGAMAATLLKAVHPGAVILLHQDRPATVDVLDSVLEELGRRGFRSVGISRLGTCESCR